MMTSEEIMKVGTGMQRFGVLEILVFRFESVRAFLLS
jgi:hypothetical protein